MATLVLEYEDRLGVIEQDCRQALTFIEVKRVRDGRAMASLRFAGEEISAEYPIDIFKPGVPLEYIWVLLANEEGLLSARLNGVVLWSVTQDLVAEASKERDPEEEALRQAAKEVAEEEEREYVRFWMAAHPGVEDVPTISKQTGVSRAVVRRTLMAGSQEEEAEVQGE